MDQHDDATTLQCAIYWLLAIEYQGVRVIDAWHVEEGRHYPFLNVRMMEEHFFLVACNKARRWVDKLKAISEDDAPLVEFLNRTKAAQTVRNKREHDDEYFGSGGAKANRPRPRYDVDCDSPVSMVVGPACSVNSQGKLLLGGLFDVHEGIQSAKTLQIILRQMQHEYWDNRAHKPGMCDHFKMPEKWKERGHPLFPPQ